MNKELVIHYLLISAIALLFISIFSPLISEHSFLGIQSLNLLEIFMYGVFTGVEFLIPCAFFITIIVGLISAIAIFNYKDYYQILISIGWLSLIIIGFLVYELSNENLMLGWGGVTIILANISLIAVGAISKSKDDHH